MLECQVCGHNACEHLDELVESMDNAIPIAEMRGAREYIKWLAEEGYWVPTHDMVDEWFATKEG